MPRLTKDDIKKKLTSCKDDEERLTFLESLQGEGDGDLAETVAKLVEKVTALEKKREPKRDSLFGSLFG